MRNIKLKIEYDGKDFNGWQKQKDKPNIQGLIEYAISQVTKEDIELIGSGRTDSNVHALGQVANFKTNSKIPIEKFPIAINTYLNKSIRILEATEVEEDFNSRFCAKKKTYRYVINDKYMSAIYRNLEVAVPYKIDVEKLNRAIKYLIGEHDFTSFKSSGGSTKGTIRTIYDAKVYRNEQDRVCIEITGNGFLYNMVRIIVGTLLEINEKNLKEEHLKYVLEQKDRKQAGKTAPAHGLYLVDVNY